MEDLLSCLYAFGGCAAFCVIFEMRRWQFILSAAGIGMVARAACLLLSGISEVFQLLLAAIVTSILAEIFARILKTPATVLLIIGIIPLVPGGGAYYTMEYLVGGETQLAMETGIHTLFVAGAIAMGIVLVSSMTRILAAYGRRRREKQESSESA